MVKGVLLDLSGVLYIGDDVVPGAPQAVARLREAGLPVRFLTNSTRKPRRLILERLRRLGIELQATELTTPVQAARDWLDRNGYSPHLLIHPDLSEDFADCAKDSPKAIVVGDAGRAFTYQALNAAFREISRGAPFLALAANRIFFDADGELSLDAGPFVHALEHASGVAPVLFGKPAPAFFAAAAASMGCTPDEVAMVGDDAEADVAGALSAGVGMGVLVRTGKYRAGDESKVAPPPTEIADDVGAAVEIILE